MRRDAREALVRLGRRIFALRRERGLTQEQLATTCGLSQKYLSEVERGVKAPSFETLVVLAHQGFGVRLAAFLFALDEDVPIEERKVEELLAGRPEAARKSILGAVSALLGAGATLPVPAAAERMAEPPRRASRRRSAG